MKKVLEVINLSNSAMNFIGDQFSYMQENGDYEMHLICSPGKGIEEFSEKHRIHYFPVKIERQLSPRKDLRTFVKIFNYIRKNKIDVLICHQEKSRLLGTLAGWLLSVPVRIIFAHGVLVDTMRGKKKKFYVAEGRLVSSMAHHVVCVSPSVQRRRLEEKMDQPAKQVVLGKGTCNGVDTKNHFNPANVFRKDIFDLQEQFGLQKDDFVVGFCGRIVRDKGIIELADAIKILHERYPEKKIKLLIVGDPEKRDAVPCATINFLKESPLVVFTGRAPYSRIQNYYMLMDVFVLPSYREGFGQVTIEANAMRVPAIVSKATGCVDSIKAGVSGIFTEIKPDAIADAIEKFFDSAFALPIKQQCREYVVENFEHTIVRKNILDFLDSVTK